MQRHRIILSGTNRRLSTTVLLLSMASTALLRVVNVMMPNIFTAMLFFSSLAVLAISLIVFECQELKEK